MRMTKWVWGDLESIGEVINTKDHEGVLTFDSRGKNHVLHQMY